MIVSLGLLQMIDGLKWMGWRAWHEWYNEWRGPAEMEDSMAEVKKSLSRYDEL